MIKTFWISRDEGGMFDTIELWTRKPKLQNGKYNPSRVSVIVSIGRRDFIRLTGINLNRGEYGKVKLMPLFLS